MEPYLKLITVTMIIVCI